LVALHETFGLTVLKYSTVLLLLFIFISLEHITIFTLRKKMERGGSEKKPTRSIYNKKNISSKIGRFFAIIIIIAE